MNSAIKAIIFDVGGVLVRTFDQSGRRVWEERLGLAPGEAELIVLNSEIGRRAQHGLITEDEQWKLVGQRLNLGDDLESFRRDFWKGDAVDPDLLKLVRRLGTRYQLGIISNAPDGLLRWLELYGLLTEFSVIVGSAYEGVMKPDPAIFRTALARLGREPEEAVFIDDAPANVAAAREIGMRAIRFTPSLDLAAELSALGVRVDD